MTDKPKPKRRWLQFSLRTMMLVVTVFCIWMGFYVKQVREQRIAIEAILELDGSISYYDYEDGYLTTRSYVPAWLRQFFGEDYFSSVVEVGLTDLNVYHKVRAGLPVRSDDIAITDADLAHVKRLTKIRRLSLSYAQISDAGLAELRDLTTLRFLDLQSSRITDGGLVHLTHLTKLKFLGLGHTEVTDAGLEKLKGLTNLQTLLLSNTQVTDAGLANLEGLTNLQVLDLSSTQITDAGLVQLKGLTNLQSLHLNNTKITDDGAKKLQKALPSCQFIRFLR